ncbi:MAG: response regulator [Planctomycetota bacterium]
MQPTDNRPIETIRLSEKDKAKLVNQLEQAAAQQVSAERRSLRVKFTAPGTVVRLQQPNGASSRLSVLPRNLSKQGMAFIHGRFVYPGVQALVTLPTIDGELMTVEGRIRDCRHVSGIVHEVSVVFDDLIDLAMFVEMTRDEEVRYRQERAEDLGADAVAELAESEKPRVLLLESADTDRKLYALWLKKAGLDVTEAATSTEAGRAASSGSFDLALVSVASAEEAEAIEQLQGLGLTSPMIALTMDSSGGAADAAMQAGCSSVLAKPFQAEELKQAVEQLVDVAGGQAVDPLVSTAADDEDMAPLLMEYVDGLAAQVQQLRGCLTAKDWDTMRQLGSGLKGSGGGYGFAPISEAAGQLLDSLDASETPNVDDVRKDVEELVGLLRRARAT